MIPTDHYIRFSRVDEVSRIDTGLRARLHGEELRIEVVHADLVRISMSRAGRFDEQPTHAVCVDPLAEPADFEVVTGPDRTTLTTPALQVTLGLDPFRLDVHRADGSPVIETALDADGQPWAYATLNDAFTFRRRCRAEDAIYGLGEKGGRHNRKGRDFTLWNTDVLDPNAAKAFTDRYPEGDPRADRTSTEFDPYYASIPFFYHLRYPTGETAGSFLDNGYRSVYDFTAPDEYRVHVDGGQWTEYVFAGPAIPDILTAYTWLTGRMAPPPLWSLGYHQCRWAVYTADQVEAIAVQHRDLGVPCDALWLDIEYMDGYRVFTWNTDLFPDPPQLLERLAEQGFRAITIIDPGVKYDPGYPVFDAGVEADVFCRTQAGDLYVGQVWPGNTVFPDFATTAGRRWWGDLNAAHVESGLAGIWNDMNEPATGAIVPDRMRFDRGEVPHERLHNQYALLMAMATTAGLREARPELRTFVLSRSGFAGIQRYAANWLGDNQSRWDHLALSIAMGAGFGLSGQAFVGADIGGFQGNTDPELFLRWMQYGTLTPFCRNHSEIGNIDQYAWSFGETVQDDVRAAIELRYRLLPYLYACFLTATETGAPVQRPLVFDHQGDGAVRDLDDQYLLGPDLLVAPVIGPGVTARQVYLPAGQWYDWHTDEALSGRRFVLAPTPMHAIPIYARAGAVIPMWPEAPPSTMGYHPSEIELHLFVPTRDGTWTSMLTEDDGLTFDAWEGGRYRTTLTVERDGDRVTVGGSVEGHGYAEFARRRFVVVTHGAQPAAVDVDGASLAPQQGHFAFDNAGSPFTLSFRIE